MTPCNDSCHIPGNRGPGWKPRGETSCNKVALILLLIWRVAAGMALPCEEEGQRFRMANNSQTTCSWSWESRISNAFAWTASSSGTSISPSELTAPIESCRYPPPDQVGANLRALHHLFGPKQLGQNEGNGTPKPPREEGELTSLDALTRASTRVCPSWKGV